LSITIGDTLTTPAVLETSFWSVWRRGSVARGSLWEELEELPEEDEPELDLLELEEPLAEPEDPDLEEVEELEAAGWAEPEALDFDDPEPDAPDLLEPPEPAELDFELLALDDPEPDPDAGWAGDPSFTAISRGPFTPGPKYFAVRS
jgi:hypothetical protein